MSNKALIFSDLHIHKHKDNHDRLQNCIDVIVWIFETAIKEGCKTIFFLGDLYHERSKIDVFNYLKTFEVFMKYSEADFQTYLLIGNHDMYHKEKWDVNSVKPLTAIKNVNVIEKPTTMVFGKTHVDFLPHTETPITHLKHFKDKEKHILLAHLAVQGAILNKIYGTKSEVIEYDNDMEIISPQDFDSWKMTFLGHYHNEQKLSDRAEYVGSPIQLSFGEAFQKKHIIILDLDTLEKKYIENDFSPKHFILHAEDVDKYDLENQYVNMSVSGLNQQEVVDIKKKLIEKKVADFEIKKKEKKEVEDHQQIESAKAILLDHKQMLLEFIKKNLPPELKVDIAMSIGEGLCQETP